MKDSTIIFAVIILSVTILIYGANTTMEDRTVTVVGNAEVEAVPDVFYASIGVEILDDDSQDAQRRASVIIEDLKQSLFELGLVEANILREEYRVSPRYDYSLRTAELIGYSVYRGVNIRVDDVELAGPILDVARDNNANVVSNVRFDLSDAKRKELRETLLKEAKKEAELEAKSVIQRGRLGPALKIDVNQQFYPMMRSAGLEAMDGGTTIEPGLVTSSASVSVTYKIR